MQFFKGVVFSEGLALWVEFFYKFGVKFHPKGFFIAIPLYFIYLCLLHRIFGLFKKKRFLWLIGIALGGMAGLLLEWFLVGNSPWNKPAVFQSGQLLFHGAYPILGYLVAHTVVADRLRNRLFIYMVFASGITSIGFFLSDPNLKKLWLLFLPLMAFLGLYYFIYELATRRSQSSTAASMTRVR
ncbi:MAG: hypothetical protein OEZ05_07095 [Nitrospirota bacterium]|nr:hypothetical protein [Nitrospirota bacterium]MDH5586380.1 hypothetical protein [Nitrospirota bacterium]